ncbi:MAG TPA: T9SS type A sorting domain-containing protein, partial [Bacteroidia bacterium]|nr:T9SS type A sorting domain-containing protein [Bacteroidia bacterium]
TPLGGLQFQLVTSLALTDRSPNSSHFTGNLYVSQVDVPAIRDMDGDGDLDVLTFQNAGTEIEYHRNMGMELYHTCDSIHFQVESNCWGGIAEDALNAAISMGVTCPNPPIVEDFTQYSAQHSAAHSGSCLECINTDGDDDQDVLIGDISYAHSTFVHNGGSAQSALIDYVDSTFPSYNVPVNQQIMPCGFHLDVNNDGKKDILFSPNTGYSSDNYASIAYYMNVGDNDSVVASYVQNNFLQDNEIEVGEGCYPVFFDYDNDGDKDLFIGDLGYYNIAGPLISKIALYKNTGTSTHPVFSKVTNDFANIYANGSGIVGLAPCFADLDGDGDKDMLVGAADGRLYYFEKMPGPDDNFVLSQAFYQNIDVGSNAVPQLIDVDHDNKVDLLVGNQAGRVYYYHNTGTSAAPAFTQASNFFGGIDVRQPAYYTGYAVPRLYMNNGQYEMLVGSERGYIYKYDDIDNNLSGTFNLVDSMYISTREGGQLSPYIDDINGDGLYDVIIGNFAGGASIFMGDNNVSTGELAGHEKGSFNLYPDPANDFVTIEFPNGLFSSGNRIDIFNIAGQCVYTTVSGSARTTVPVAGLSPGVYICSVTDPAGARKNKKLIITH